MSRIIGGATVNQTPLDWNGNMANIRSAITAARDNGITVLGLPELCITAYGCEDLFLSEWLPAKAMEHLLQLVPDCHDITVALGLPVRFQGKLYNCTCLVSNCKILGFTAKQYLALDGVHYEPRWFEPWRPDEVSQIEVGGTWYPFGDVTYETAGFKIGIEICEDAWREQTRPAPRLHSKGIDLIINSSASHFAFGKTRLREELVIGSSKQFQCTYLYTNMLGNEAGRMIFDGEILVAKDGHLLARNHILSFRNMEFIKVDVDAPQPVESYDFDKNLEFTQAVTLGLFDYLRKSRSRGFVLSLSGGADSSTCLVLVAQMIRSGVQRLGLEGFLEKIGRQELIEQAPSDEEATLKYLLGELMHCVYQSSANSSTQTLESARELCEGLGGKFDCWDIDREVALSISKMEKVLDRKLSWEQDDIALQNIQARVRSPQIWMLANIKGSLLIATSNRSEGDTGYATMDGDTSGSISPIAGVDKQFIRQWLLWAEKALNYPQLRHVNSIPPSAELRPKENQQTDENDLMPYDILVEIEKRAIKDRFSPIETFQSLLPLNLTDSATLKNYVGQFYRLWTRSQWKRERLAPSFHLDDFNIDPKTWCRFPILSHGFENELEELDAS